jgi:hypothetical protein
MIVAYVHNFRVHFLDKDTGLVNNSSFDEKLLYLKDPAMLRHVLRTFPEELVAALLQGVVKLP